MKAPDSVAIVSGGLDSTTLVYLMLEQGYTPHMLSFNYGQRHKKELQFAELTADNLGLRFDVVDLRGLTHLISNSALTSPSKTTIQELDKPDSLLVDKSRAIEVPEGHYAEDTMKQTVVPNRNMIMLAIAAGVAVNNKYRTIGTGVHAGDHFIYPDCRPEFINGMNQLIPVANEGFHFFDGFRDITDPTHTISSGAIWAPFLSISKADIAYEALRLGVPLHFTWSCYKGGDKHCGRCGTCVERLEAIHEAQQRYTRDHNLSALKDGIAPSLADQTEYEDTEYWKVAIREANRTA